MCAVKMDLCLLAGEGSSKSSFIHAKMKNLVLSDINFSKVAEFNYSSDSVAGWLKLKYPIPLKVLKNLNCSADKIEYLCIRASSSRVKIPSMNEDLAYFLGVVFGDGYICDSIRDENYRRFRIGIQKKRTHYSEFVIPEAIKTVFGVKPNLSFWKRKSDLVTITINSRIISNIFTNVFGFSYGKKSDRVIDFIEKLPEKLQFYFSVGLLDTDGGRSGGSFAFCNSSKKAALFIKKILEKQNIGTRFYRQSKGKFKWYQVRVQGKDKYKFLSRFPLKNESKYAGGGN